MYSTIKRFLPEEVTVNRIVGRTEDLIAETAFVGTYPARIQNQTINVTDINGVDYKQPSMRVFIAEIDNPVSIGDLMTLPGGEQREITAVGDGTVTGDYRYVEVTL